MVNAIIILFAVIALMLFNGQLRGGLKTIGDIGDTAYFKKLIGEKPWALLAYGLLFLILIGAFYVRFATSWNTYFFEFDPYFYDRMTEFVVKEGAVPLNTDIVSYPRSASYRAPPLISYVTGSWYSLYQQLTSSPFSIDDFVPILQLYPPLCGVFLAFLSFVFIREESNRYIGLVASAFFAFTPQLVKKLAAGVTEVAPIGLLSALFFFTTYALAINRKDMRLAWLSAFAVFFSVLSSNQYVWPLIFFTIFLFISSFLEYLTGTFEESNFKINSLVVASFLAGELFSISYQGLPISLGSIPFLFLLLFVAYLPSLFFFFISKTTLERRFSRKQILGALVLFILILSVITPIGFQGIRLTSDMLQYAKSDAPLSRTIQEENATSEGLFVPSFGILNPKQLLIGSTILLVLLAMLSLRKRSFKSSIVFGIVAGGVILLNAYLDMVLAAISSVLENSFPEISVLIRFLMDGDVFIYLIISLISLIIYYFYEEKRSKMYLLFLLIFFPTAYIGLNKVKYLLHLAFALALALPFVLILFMEAIQKLNGVFKIISDEAQLKRGLLIFVLLIGIVAAYKQFETTPQSMAELSYSRMSQDWIDTTQWMRLNLTENDRVSSWWDYGHWTTFFGGAKTVLNPGNAYADYDQLTAQAYVGGNTSFLIDVLHYHKATHILVDSELVQKWGALVYLSGTFTGITGDNRYDRKASIPSTNSPGSSEYETEHYFEYLYGVYTQTTTGQYQRTLCPGIIPKQMYFSSFGALYCMDAKGSLFLFSQTGNEAQLKDPKLVRTDDSQLAPAPLGNTQGLFFNQRFGFINLNPDLEAITDGRLKSNLYASAFVKLFFLEELEGFQLAYKSPNGQVKIFKLIA
jgi:asparagine N-glycosylation enzyme membrane subunit Stt3